ncbi:hypothetical protein DFR70_101774 [Nocardia tenerifensis]|uniref:Uncharacterized protein n=1 Tax=Nocardia tenerifensis TaxID=228006 RepID=A0A318KGG3_9NOCA|nr:hypothetical protein [Nocardia tenerifensis]PXX71352.1 hypothetical protein DFR70_101774 [Nocardia tenerifensis]
MNELQLWRVGQIWRLWRVVNVWRLWRLVLQDEPYPLVRPLLGLVAALVLIVGGVVAFSYADGVGRPRGSEPSWQINTNPIIRPLPPNYGCSQGN